VEININYFQKHLHARLVEGRRGRKETLDSKKEVLRLEEPHKKTSHTDTDHIPCAALGIKKHPLKFQLQTVVK